MYLPCENCKEAGFCCDDCYMNNLEALKKLKENIKTEKKEKLIIQEDGYNCDKVFCPSNLKKQEAIQTEYQDHLLKSLIFLIEEGIIDAKNYTLLAKNGEEIHPKGTLNPNFGKKKAFIFIDDGTDFGFVGFPKSSVSKYQVDETGDLVIVIKFLIKYGFEDAKNFNIIYGTDIFDMLKEN